MHKKGDDSYTWSASIQQSPVIDEVATLIRQGGQYLLESEESKTGGAPTTSFLKLTDSSSEHREYPESYYSDLSNVILVLDID